MSSPSPPLDVEDDSEQVFSVSLTVYSKVKNVLRGKSTMKEEKSTKTKELLFTIKPANYVDFLKSMLQKHGQEDYEVTAKKHYPFRYTLPKTKGQRTVDAIDVDNLTDYEEMVTKIVERKPSAVKILVDMRHIQKLPRVQASSGDDSAPSSDSKVKPNSAKADLDSRLARWRIKLQQKYKNEHNDMLTYVGPLGALTLTPAMVLDWARFLEEGQATLSIPPNIESFNPANKAPILHAQRALAQPQPQAPPAVDINSLTSVLLIQTLAQSGLLSSAAGVATSNPPTSASTHAAVQSPRTPTWQKNHGDVALPPSFIPSPSHLTRYLEYAVAHLGVRHALTYKSALEINGIGPDILPDVEDKFLSDLGISAGDVIRLKKGTSRAWWNDPDAKRKRSDTAGSAASGVEQPVKKVAYQKRFHEGGGARFTGPPMRQDDAPGSPLGQDYDLLYFCDVQNQWLPVPRGFTVDEAAELEPSHFDL